MTDHLARLSEVPLDVAEHLDHVGADWVGGVATFIGTVRNHSPDVHGEVVRLDYSAHPSAPTVLAEIVDEVARAHPGVRLAVSHRVGTLTIGDLAIVAAAGSSHRAEAFAACREAVETVKKRLPVWKRQVLADGSYVWVGSA